MYWFSTSVKVNWIYCSFTNTDNFVCMSVHLFISQSNAYVFITCMAVFYFWRFANLWQRFQSVKHLTSSSSGPHLIFFHYNTFSNIFEKKISLNPDIFRYIWRNVRAIGISAPPWGSSDLRGKRREIHVCLNISRCISQKTF